MTRAKKKDAAGEAEPEALERAASDRTLDLVVEEVGPEKAPDVVALDEGLADPKVSQATMEEETEALAHTQGATSGHTAQPLGMVVEEVSLEGAAAPDKEFGAPKVLQVILGLAGFAVNVVIAPDMGVEGHVTTGSSAPLPPAPGAVQDPHCIAAAPRKELVAPSVL